MALDPPLVHAACGLGHHLYRRMYGVRSQQDVRNRVRRTYGVRSALITLAESDLGRTSQCHAVGSERCARGQSSSRRIWPSQAWACKSLRFRAIWIPAKPELKVVSPPPPKTLSVLQGTSHTVQQGPYLSINASVTRPIILHSRKQKEQAKKHRGLSPSRNQRPQPRSSEFNHTFPYETRRLIYDYLLGDELIRLECPSHEPTLRL